MSKRNKRQKNKILNTDTTVTAETAADTAETSEENSDEAVSEDVKEEEGTAQDGVQAENQDGEEKSDPRDVRIKELEDKTVRQMAEFDNYRKRTEKEKTEMFDLGMKNMIDKILPVVDNFERGIAAGAETGETNAFAEGMNMVYKQLMKVLEDAGVTAIEAVGKEFDPTFHNAVMHEEDDSGEENIITQELQKGYMYKDQVLRHSMVKVKN